MAGSTTFDRLCMKPLGTLFSSQMTTGHRFPSTAQIHVLPLDAAGFEVSLVDGGVFIAGAESPCDIVDCASSLGPGSACRAIEFSGDQNANVPCVKMIGIVCVIGCCII